MITRKKYKKNEFVGEVKVEKTTCCDGCDVGYTDKRTHYSYIVSSSDIVREKKVEVEEYSTCANTVRKRKFLTVTKTKGH